LQILPNLPNLGGFYLKIFLIKLGAPMEFNINTDAAVRFTNTLERMHKSALPNAIRGTLNKVAFDVKKNTIERAADAKFVKRAPNFFKANSKVEMAKGWNVSGMRSIVGFTSEGLSGGNNYAVKDLEQQEHGGSIDKKSFIPLTPARSNKAKPVRPVNRLSKINNIVNSKNAKGKNKHEKFIKSVIHAGVGGYVLGNQEPAVLFRVLKISSKKLRVRGRSNTTRVKLKPLYTFKKDRSVSVNKTGFMQKASLESASKLDVFFQEEAKRQFEKLKNKR
jgi:hypothetical protein